ncbi:MAG: type II toxin-antitoxin system YafQ family toxin [Roseburia sp.]|nr:type II toxin-antitoxin system YafQ family toxin [Roseburia sp.]
MKYTILTTKRFDKALQRCAKRGYPIEKLRTAIKLLSENGSLPNQYHPHLLHGNHCGEWEAHIAPDWLLIWEQDDEN